VIFKVNEIFAGDRYSPELNKDIDTIQALATRQTAKFDQVDVLLDVLDCRGAKVVFLKSCTNTATDIVETPIDACDLTGAETESVSLTLANNLGYKDTFKVLGSDCKDKFTVSDKIAHLMAAKMANIEEKLNLAGIAFLTANEQPVADPLEYGETGNVVNIPTDSWAPELLAEFAVMAKLSNLYNPFIISGSNLYVANFLAQYRSASSPSVDSVLTVGPFDIIFDIKNIDSTVGANATFLVDPSAYAFWPSNQYDNTTPQPFSQGSTLYVWKQRAPRLMWNNNGNIEPVYFDMETQEVCEVVSGVKYVNRVFAIIFRGGLQLGPQVCVSTDTGILQFNELAE
jgi:hypothetical protein